MLKNIDKCQIVSDNCAVDDCQHLSSPMKGFAAMTLNGLIHMNTYRFVESLSTVVFPNTRQDGHVSQVEETDHLKYRLGRQIPRWNELKCCLSFSYIKGCVSVFPYHIRSHAECDVNLIIIENLDLQTFFHEQNTISKYLKSNFISKNITT